MTTPPSLPILQMLHGLDTSSSEFGDNLCNILCGDEYSQCELSIEGKDLVWLVGYLDMVLPKLTSAALQESLRKLRGVCGTQGVLPASYIIPASRLNIDREPFASVGFGDVHKGTFDGLTVRIKRVRAHTVDTPEKILKAFCREVVTWRQLEHPNIVPLLGVTISPWLQLVSCWMSDGNLPEYVKKCPNTNRAKLLLDVAKGLEYLHSHDVVHGDLKGSNILMDNSGCARIADHGLAEISKDLASISSTSHHHGLNAQWAAPEVVKEAEYGKKADIFSFAMVMIEVFAGEVPFSGHPNSMTALSIMEGKRPPRPAHPFFTERLWSLTQRCWDHNPLSRPEALEVMQILLVPDVPAWRQLNAQALSTDERITLITVIFSDPNQIKMVENISGDDAQNFIDKINEALDRLTPSIHQRCLHYLSKICGRQALLPRSLMIPLCYDQTEDAVFRGGLADVWKGRHEGRDVAAHVFKILSGEDAEQIKGRFCGVAVTWRALHPNVLPLLGVTITENRLVMVSEWMAKGNIKEFTQADARVDRLRLLVQVAKGLIYLHEQGIIHGDLIGTNILIDNEGHARLTGFGLATIASTLRYAQSADSAVPWKSPELLFPVKFGLAESCPTKESDCYALGMVIYEVLSGLVPFAHSWSFQIAFMVLEGKRPTRPQGDEGRLFTDAIWEIVERCWNQQPSDRPSAGDVLNVLEEAQSLSVGPLTARSSEGLPAPKQGGDNNEGWVGTLMGSVGQFFGLFYRK